MIAVTSRLLAVVLVFVAGLLGAPGLSGASEAVDFDMPGEDERPTLPPPDWQRQIGFSSVTSVDSDTVFTTEGSPYTVVDTLLIENTADLYIQQGVTVKLADGAAIIVEGEIKCNGTADEPIVFEPAQPGDRWLSIGLIFTNSTAVMHHCHFIGGSTMTFDTLQLRGQLAGYFSDVDISDCLFDDGLRHHISFAGMTGVVQRSTFLTALDEPIDSNFNTLDVLDNVIFDAAADAIDVNSNNDPVEVSGNMIAVGVDDGIDLDDFVGVCSGNTIYGMVDKGISASVDSDCRLENNIIWSCGQGFGLTNRSVVEAWNNTLVDNEYGMRIREKSQGAGGANVTGANNIVWGNDIELEVDAASSLDLTYSNVEGGHPGVGNVDADPLFVDPAARDYHILTGSPCIDAGQGTGAPLADYDGDVRVDDATVPDTGAGVPSYVDIGADEFWPEVASILVSESPAQISLLRVAPQPISGAGVITVQLGADARGALKLYDVHGRMQRVWQDVAGTASIEWDTTDGNGQVLAHGVYFLEYRRVDGASFRSRLVVVP